MMSKKRKNETELGRDIVAWQVQVQDSIMAALKSLIPVNDIVGIIIDYDQTVMTYLLPTHMGKSWLSIVLRTVSPISREELAGIVLRPLNQQYRSLFNFSMVIGRTGQANQSIILIYQKRDNFKRPRIEEDGRIKRLEFDDYVTPFATIARTRFPSTILTTTINELDKEEFGILWIRTVTAHGYNTYLEFDGLVNGSNIDVEPEKSYDQDDSAIPELWKLRKKYGCKLNKVLDGVLCDCNYCRNELHHYCREKASVACPFLEECHCMCGDCEDAHFKESDGLDQHHPLVVHCQNNHSCFAFWKTRNHLV